MLASRDLLPNSRLFDLSGRNAIVTGAAAGIGLAIARRLAEAGANVLLSDVRDEPLEQARLDLAAGGRPVHARVADIGREGDIVSLLACAAERLGGVDILVNNAGIYPKARLLEMTTEQWRRVQRINLEGAFLCSREAGRQMVAQGRGGVIVNVASMTALKPCHAGLGHYAASKGGVINLTRSLALELAPHRIRAVAVAPGGIWTEGTQAEVGQLSPEELARNVLNTIPLGDFGDPDDIARAVVFLASSAAAYITGTTLLVDGGAMLV